MDKALAARASSLEKVSKRLLRKYLRKSNFDNLDALLEDLALGQQLANIVAAKLVPKIKGKDDDRSSE